MILDLIRSYIPEECHPQHLQFGNPTKIGGGITLSPREITQAIIPNAIISVYQDEGGTFQAIPLQTGVINFEQVSLDTENAQTKGVFVIPVYPWGGNGDIMFIHTGEPCKSIQALQKDELEIAINTTTNIINEKLERTQRPVYWGMTGSLTRYSVPLPHWHISQLNQPSCDTPERIDQFRQTTNWDHGLTREIASRDEEAIREMLSGQDRDFVLTSDSIGNVIRFPSETTQLFREPNFISQIFIPLLQMMEERIEEVHNYFYGVSINSLHNQILSELDGGPRQVDLKTIFSSVDIDKIEIDHGFNRRYLDLYLMDKDDSNPMYLRKPGSYGLMIKVEPQGVTIYTMYSFVEEEIGPFESIGIKLKEAQPSSPNLIGKDEIINIQNAVIK